MSTHEPGLIAWRTSSYSGGNGACVEVGWRKSSYSSGNGDCVEVAVGETVHVRDTKNRAGGALAVPGTAWAALLGAVRSGSLGC